MNIISCKSILNLEKNKEIEQLINDNLNIDEAANVITKKFNIQITTDPDLDNLSLSLLSRKELK